MKILRNNKKTIIIFGIILLAVIYIVSCKRGEYYAPKGKRQDIAYLLDKEKLNKEEYEILFSQTGLGKSAIDEMLEKGEREKILVFSRQYFEKAEYERKFLFFPLVITEEKGIATAIAPLKRGDVLISLSTHTLGFRHGHAGMVLNGKTGETVEHFLIGDTSKKGKIYNFSYYPTLAVLRYKDKEIAQKAADYAEKNLIGIKYNPLAGIIKKDKQDENPVSSSHCSHLIWQAYKAAGADIDGNGGILVLPKDFLRCDDFEIVQIYGIKP